MEIGRRNECPFTFRSPTCPSTQNLLDPISMHPPPTPTNARAQAHACTYTALYLLKSLLTVAYYGHLRTLSQMSNVQPFFVNHPQSCTIPVHRFKTSLCRIVYVRQVLTLMCFTTALVGSEDIRHICRSAASAERINFNQRYACKCLTTGSLGERVGWGKCPVLQHLPISSY